jgi:hypothetical protein
MGCFQQFFCFNSTVLCYTVVLFLLYFAFMTRLFRRAHYHAAHMRGCVRLLLAPFLYALAPPYSQRLHYSAFVGDIYTCVLSVLPMNRSRTGGLLHLQITGQTSCAAIGVVARWRMATGVCLPEEEPPPQLWFGVFAKTPRLNYSLHVPLRLLT